MVHHYTSHAKSPACYLWAPIYLPLPLSLSSLSPVWTTTGAEGLGVGGRTSFSFLVSSKPILVVGGSSFCFERVGIAEKIVVLVAMLRSLMRLGLRKERERNFVFSRETWPLFILLGVMIYSSVCFLWCDLTTRKKSEVRTACDGGDLRTLRGVPTMTICGGDTPLLSYKVRMHITGKASSQL